MVGLEVTQVVQDLANSVPLVAEKPTVVRVYLDRPAPGVVTVRGELEVTAAGNGPILVPSINTLDLDPAQNGKITDKRLKLQASLNFRLPSSVTVPGLCSLRTGAIRLADTGEQLDLVVTAKQTVEFREVPPLRIRLVSIRYQTGSPPREHEPSALDLSLIESWLRRAYPVSQVVLTKITVAAAKPGPINDASLVNVRLTAMRNADMASGGDALAHYFGLVADSGGFMRGLASVIPTQPDPSAVASGPTGPQGYPWDTDGSYGDWYTGHELAHTFGRRHLGSGCGDTPNDPTYPFPAGQLCGPDERFVGFDIGDPPLGLPMTVYPGMKYHDVMCYCPFIWMSDHTYTRLLDRITAEAQPPAGPLAMASMDFAPSETIVLEAVMTKWLNIVGRVNFTRRTGNIDVMQPLAGSNFPSGDEGRARIELYDGEGQLIETVPARVKFDACRDEVEEETGIVDTFAPLSAETQRVALRVFEEIVDSREAPGARGPAGLAFAGGDNEKYTVQVSTDEGATWQTIAVGADTPEYDVRRRDFPNARRLRARVIATDGFKSRLHREDEIA